MMTDPWIFWATLAGSVATCVATTSGVLFVFHARRTSMIQELRSEIAALDLKVVQLLTQQRRDAERAHDLLASQLRDLARSVNEGYVMRRDFDQAVAGLHGVLVEARREIGTVHTRIDDVYKRADFRKVN